MCHVQYKYIYIQGQVHLRKPDKNMDVTLYNGKKPGICLM